MIALPGAPYGNAPAWCFHFTELSVFAFMIGSVIHAYKRGNGALAYLLGGTAFGLLLEYFEVVTGSYTYGRFWLMFGRAPLDVPLFVGFAWGIIMYTARLFSDAAGLPLLAGAALDTLLALNIDLGMDTVAYRMHFWNWDWSGTDRNPLTAAWFGIPYGNFVGWITVVFCFSIFSRLFERRLRNRPASSRAWCIPALAAICSLTVLVSTELVVFPVLNQAGINSKSRLVLLVVVLLFVTLRGLRERRPSGQVLHPLAKLVPAWFHVFFVYCFFAVGFYRENGWMTAITCLNLVVAVAVHCLPVISRPASRIQRALFNPQLRIQPAARLVSK